MTILEKTKKAIANNQGFVLPEGLDIRPMLNTERKSGQAEPSVCHSRAIEFSMLGTK